MGSRIFGGTGIPDPPSKTTSAPLIWNGAAWVNAQVASAGIADNAIVAAKIAALAVGTTKLADGAVTDAKVAAGIAPSKIAQAGASTGQALVWNGSAWAPGTVSGGAGGGVDPNTFDAKGDLLVGTADNTYTKFPAGTNGQIIVYDSSQATGLRAATPTPAPLVLGLSPQLSNYTPTATSGGSGTVLLISGLLSFCDLSPYSEARFMLLTPTGWGAGAKVRPQYSTDAGVNWQFFENSGTAFEMDGTPNDSASGLTTVVRRSAWSAIQSNAKGEVDIRVVLYGQGTTAAGSIRNCYMIFR